MDYDDNDFQNQNLHLAGEANSKFPPVLQPYALPKFDFDDTLNPHLRFDSLVGTEVFLGIEGNEDSNWIEDFSRGSSGIVFSSGANESCAISRHNNVWSEATSSESVEMLLNSVGQDEVIVRENTIKKSDTSDVLGCTMEQMEAGQTFHEKSLSDEETENLQPNPPVDDTPGESSVLKTEAAQEPVLVKYDAPTVVEEPPVEEENAILASDTAVVEAADTADHDKIGADTADSLLGQMKNEANAQTRTEVNCAADHDKIGTEVTDRLLHQTENEANAQTRMEVDCAADHDKIGTEMTDCLLDQTENEANEAVHTLVTCTGELNNQKTLLPVTFNDENDISDHVESSSKRNDLTIDSQSDFAEAHSDSHLDSAPEVKNVEAENSDESAKPDLQEMVLSNVTVLERGDQTLSTLEVGGQDVSGSQCQDLLVSSADTSVTVEASLELAGELTTLTSSVSTEKRESLGYQQMEVTASEHETTFQTETHAQIHLVETSESVLISHVDSMVESPIGGVSTKSDNDEGSVHTSILMQSMEVAATVHDRGQDAKSPPILSETVVSESAGYVSGGSASNLAESKSQFDIIPRDKSVTTIDGKECKAFSPNPEGLQQLNQDGAPAVSLTSSIDSLLVKASSDGNEQGTLSEIEKISSDGPENSDGPETSQTVPPVDASSPGSRMDQQATTHIEDTQQSTQFVDSCPGLKDVVDTDTDAVLPQQSEETISEEHLVTEVGNAPEIQSIMDKDEITENPNTSSLAKEEDNTAASRDIMAAGTPVSHLKVDIAGDAFKLRDSRASTCSEPSLKSHVTGTESAATYLGAPISFPIVKTSDLQLNKIEANISEKPGDQNKLKPEDQNKLNCMSARSPMLNRNEIFNSGMNLISDPRKPGDIFKAVNFSEATIGSPVVVGSPSTCSLEKTPAKSVKTKPERKPRRTSKSAGKETSRKGSSVKGDTTPLQQFQSGGKANAVKQNSACSIQMTQSIEKQQSLQTPALKAFGTFSTPTASLPDLNSSALSSILRRPFTDLQQVQLRAQIFVYGALIQGTAPDEAYMVSAFGGQDGGKSSWEKLWRACAVRAQKLHLATPETPVQSRAGKLEAPSASHTNSKENSATNPIIPLSSPLWSLSTSIDTLQPSGMQRGSATAHQHLLSSSPAHQTPPVTNAVGHNTPWMSPLPYRNPWLASAQTSGFDVGSRFPVFPITTEPVKLTPMKESSVPYSGAKHVQSGTPSNVFKGTPTLEPTSTVAATAPPTTGTKSRKRKKMPVSMEPSPSILNSLKQTESAVSPLSMSTSVPITTTPANLASNAGILPNIVSITASPMNLVSPFSGKKIKSSMPSPIFGGNLVPGNVEVKQRYVLSEDSIDKLKEAKMHAEDASALAAAAVSHSEYVWKQIEQQRNAGLQAETQGKLAAAAVAIAAAAAVAKAAAAAANVAASAALQAKVMAEETSLPSASGQWNDSRFLGQGTPASILKGEGSAMSSSSALIAVREAAKKRVEAATAATKRAENMDSIVKAAELASEAVAQAGILVSMGHPPSLKELVEAGPSNYWRQAQESQEVQPSKKDLLEKETVATCDGTSASLRAVQTELVDGSVRMADGLFGSVSATGKKPKGQNGQKDADLAKNNALVFKPEVGSKSSIDTQTESEQNRKTTNDEDIKEGSTVEVFKEGPEVRTAWYSANVLSVEDDKAYVLFNDLSVEQGTDKLKEWVALKGESDEAPKIRTSRSVTALPYEGTRKRRRAAIGDPVWKIGDKVDSWVHDSWLEGVITEKNKKDENTVTVHFPAQGDTLTIKAWNLRPSLEWKDGKWIECSSSGGNISSLHEGDTPKEKRPKLGSSAILAVEAKDTSTSTKIVDNPELAKPPQTGRLDLGVTENTFNIGRSTTKDENKPDPLRTKRTGLQKQGSRVVFGVPKPGKKRKFMDVSKHYDSEASTKAARGERKEAVNNKPVKPIVPQPGGWRLPSKTISREKQTTTISKPKTFKPAVKTKEKPGGGGAAASRVIPRKESASDMESDDAAAALALDQTIESKGAPVSGTPVSVPSTSTSQETTGSKKSSSTTTTSTTNKGKVAPTPSAGRLAKIEEDKALAESSSKTTADGMGMEPRRSNRRIQPTSRLLEGLQTSMMTSKIPSVSHSKSHQSQSKK